MKKIFNTVLLALIVMGISSCTKILDQNPQSSLNATTAFTTPSAVNAGLIGTYNALASGYYYGNSYVIFPDLESDNLDHTGTYPTYQEIKNRIIDPANVDVQSVWDQIYVGINRANNIIVSATKIQDSSYNGSNPIAEAKFLRAMMYFDLMRFFGGTPTGYSDTSGAGVPLVLTPTYTTADATPKPRSSAGAVFNQINSDLNYAINNLPSVNNYGQANLLAAYALKARVALYTNNFDTAIAYAVPILSQEISNANAGLASTYLSLYQQKNTQPESIFEVQFDATNPNGLYNTYFTRTEVAASTSLAQAYDPSDSRLPVNYYFPSSSANYAGTEKYILADGSNDVTVIRLAELYLIGAEALLRSTDQTDSITATSYLNVVRLRAGLSNTTAQTIPDLLTAIANENRFEFAHEGHRWFDLRRLNLAVSTFGIADPTKVLWPIPQYEVQTSGGVITQNAGY